MTKSMRKKYLLTVILGMNLLLQVSSMLALDPRKPVDLYLHNVWTVKNGLPINSVLSISQTPDGYIWLGTEKGLTRFDGIDFEVFSHENTPTLLNDLILSLETDRNGVLWIGTRGGGITRYNKGSFDTFTTENGLLSNEVWIILETGDGAIWIGTRKGLNRFLEGKWSSIPLLENLSNNNVRALLEDRLGRVWVGTRGAGLFLVEKRGNRFESKYQCLAGLKITALLQDRRGDIWVGTEESGLVQLQRDQTFYYNTKNGFATNYIRCLLEDQAGNLWTGTHGGSVCVFKNGEDHFSFFDRERLSSNVICAFFEDRERTLWIGTEGGGLNSLSDTRITTYTVKNGLDNENITSIFQDSQGNIWIGNMGFGVNYLNKKNGRFQSLTTRDGFSANTVVSIAEHPKGYLWFGTLGGGIQRFRLKNRQIDVFTTREGLSDNFVRALYVDTLGNLWAGTDNGGLHYFSHGRFNLYDNLGFRINAIIKDRRGGMWIGTWGNGLCFLKDGKVQIYNKKSGLSDNIIMSIYEDDKEVLWIGTYNGGLYRFQEGKFVGISKTNGLPDNTIYCILEDQKHDLWMSSNQGIFCVHREELEDLVKGKIERLSPSLFTTEDGMNSIECNGGFQPAGWKTQDGKFWFPTTKGVSIVDPENIGINTLPPPVQINKVIINGTPFNVFNKAVVPPGKGDVEIHFTGLSFIKPQKILFKYKLEELDKQWVDAGTRRVANYTGIPPGSYRFRVIACNSDGIWNNTGVFFDFFLKAHYTQTLVFKIISPIAVILIIYLLYYSVKKYHSFQKIKRKYKCSPLAPNKAREYLEKMLHLLKIEKAFKDENISINSLAEKLSISSRSLSQIINEQLGKNFFELINEYRVKEAQKLLISPQEGHKSILEIGYEVGFNSKSAFNRAFKRFTRMTPSQFKKKNSL